MSALLIITFIDPQLTLWNSPTSTVSYTHLKENYLMKNAPLVIKMGGWWKLSIHYILFCMKFIGPDNVPK